MRLEAMHNITITITPNDALPDPYYQHYIWRFWRPLLGGLVFDLIVILQDYQAQGHLPTINELNEALAFGNRHTLVGRAASKTHPGREGLLQQAAKSGLLVHTVGEGDGRWERKHHFAVCERFPLLTEKQVRALSEERQAAHGAFLAEVDTAVMQRLFGVPEKSGEPLELIERFSA